jgi:hypothetical protein
VLPCGPDRESLGFLDATLEDLDDRAAHPRSIQPATTADLERIALDALPADVDAISFLQPYAGLVAAVPEGSPLWAPGLKSLETRKSRILRSGPLVVCAGLGLVEEALERFGAAGRIPAWAMPLVEQHGVALALVEVVGAARRLQPEDEPRSWFYEAGRWCWEIGWSRAFRRPFAVSGKQGRFTLPRQLVLEALAPAPGGGR